MASYAPQILPAPPQYGFLEGFAQGLPSGAQNASNVYGEAILKDRFAKKKKKESQAEINKYTEAMKQGGYDIDTSSVDESGNVKYTFKKKETPQDIFAKDPVKAIKQAMMGVGTEDVGRTLNIPEQVPLDPGAMSQNFPMAEMTGRKINSSGGPMLNYSDTVKKSLTDQFTPGYTPEQVSRDAMGLPIETPQEKAEGGFNEMAKQAVAGQVSWDYLRAQYPHKIALINRMQPELTPVKKAEDFTQGTGTPFSKLKSFFSGSQAEITPATKTVINNLKNQADLDELIKNAKKYKEQGVDVDAILEYFGVNDEEIE